MHMLMHTHAPQHTLLLIVASLSYKLMSKQRQSSLELLIRQLPGLPDLPPPSPMPGLHIGDNTVEVVL